MRGPVLSAGRCGTVLQAHVSRKGLLRMKRGCVLYGIGARRGLGWSEWCGGRSGGRMGLKRSLVCGRKGMKRDVVVAELRGKGKRLLARDIRVKRIMGEGAFGQVFEGLLANSAGEERVVLKRVKTRVRGAQEMVEMEHLLSVYAARTARASVADFIGYCGVNQEEVSGILSEGLWLVWRYEGWKTLHYYLKRRDCIAALAMDMGIPESAVAPTVMKQIFEALKGLHAAGLVHRDVKPSNLIFAESTKRFKLIDLGACADLRSGTNYVPDESILDPIYCPPEEYVLPTDCPNLGGNVLSGVISPMLWAQHMPDRFDMFSAGLIMMQLSVATLHKDSAIRGFRRQLEDHDFDLHRWRESAVNLKPSLVRALDAGNESGWNLAESLLRPRRIERSKDGGVKFIQNGSTSRISAIQALKHSFLKKASVTISASRPSVSLWQSFTRQLVDLENKILRQTIATGTQTTTVKRMRSDFATGKASKSALEREESVLNAMEAELESLAEQFEDTARRAFNVFGVVRNVGDVVSAWTGKASTSSEDSTDSPKEDMNSSSPSSRAPFFIGWWGSTKNKPSGEADVQQTSLSGDVSEEEVSEEEISEEPLVPTAAENFLYVGKKFTGLATKIGADLALALKDDVTSMFSGIEGLTMDKRKEVRAAEEYMSILKRCQPPLTSSTTFSFAEKSLTSDSSILNLPSEEHRQKIFNRFIVSLKRKKEKAQRIALSDLKAMYVEMVVQPETSWASVRSRLQGTSVFSAVEDEKAQKDLFDEVVAEFKAEEKKQSGIELDFRSMLRELDVTSSSTWPSVKRLAFSDPRYQKLLPGSRKQEIFEEYMTIVFEDERAESSAPKEDDKNILPMAVNLPGNTNDENDAALESAALKLQNLKAEQAKLKEEYRRMEERLKEMEARMEDGLLHGMVPRPLNNDGQGDGITDGKEESVKSRTSMNGVKP